MIVKIDIPDNINLMAKAEQIKRSEKNAKINLEDIFLERITKSFREDKDLIKYMSELINEKNK